VDDTRSLPEERQAWRFFSGAPRAIQQSRAPPTVSRLRESHAEAIGAVMPTTVGLHAFLRAAHVPYSVVPHPPAFTAQEEAAIMHVPGRDWAKVVICFVDGTPIEAVLPATTTVKLDRLLDLAGGRTIRLAEEGELRGLFPDCEMGAMPPFGAIYGQTVFADAALAGEADIVFNAGTHTEAIVMRWADFARAVRPIVGTFAGRSTE
jgi:Ala-tRNA(Pro) deacylase